MRKVATIAGLLLLAVGAGFYLTTNHGYVTTPSMYPTIPPGSEVVIKQQSSYSVGDVIEFRGNGLIWVHRLVQIKPDGTYVTKGDNPENAPDVFLPAITQADVVGKVVAAPRWVGFPELILHHPFYGLQWLRAELGLVGKMIVMFAAAGLTFWITWPSRKQMSQPVSLVKRVHPVNA